MTKTMTMTLEDVQHAAWQAWDNLGRCNTLDAGVKHEMCRLLDCDPHELEAVLTDETVCEIFYPTR